METEFINESGDFTDSFRAALPERLGDDFYNDPETRLQPTKELDNVTNIFDMAKRVVNGSRKISAHGEELKAATEGMVKIPGEGASIEEIAAYRTAQGVPDTKEEYELAIPDSEGKEGNTVIANAVMAAAHEAGIPKSKLSAVWDPVLTALGAQVEEQVKAGQALLDADVQSLKDVKKENYDSFIAGTNKVAAHFDVQADAATGRKENLYGSNFMKLMEVAGYKDLPAVREFLGQIAPLVLERNTAIGRGKGAEGGDEWFTDYHEVEENKDN